MIVRLFIRLFVWLFVCLLDGCGGEVVCLFAVALFAGCWLLLLLWLSLVVVACDVDWLVLIVWLLACLLVVVVAFAVVVIVASVIVVIVIAGIVIAVIAIIVVVDSMVDVARYPWLFWVVLGCSWSLLLLVVVVGCRLALVLVWVVGVVVGSWSFIIDIFGWLFVVVVVGATK